jgi:hypothetical protein
VGPDVFLTRHGFRPAREYVLRHEGRGYDSKAILGVAHGKATGRVATWDEFTGGKDGAAKWLRDLGFQVDHIDESPLDDLPATESWLEASEVGGENARLAWTAAARDVLVGTAGSYHAVVTYKELARLVQLRTGIRTSQPMRYWIGDILGRVAEHCATRGEPILTALCVNASGSVGDGYAEAVRANTGESPADPDDHAAHERLLCYQRFDAIGLPADGGQPQLTALVRAKRERRARPTKRETSPNICSRCSMAIPATGICDNCG